MRAQLLFLVGSLLLTPPALAGRHYIMGNVQDRNGEPIDRAIITLQPGNVQLVTDREGRFLIDYLRDEEGQRVRLSKKTTYTLEVFKPGFHISSTDFYFKAGSLEVEPITVVEETIQIADDGQDLDPDLYQDATHSAGANYEGQ
ncbi:MAG: carboxypeptidase regulatory-like domain-containing protein [Proteobacteria bacterium]|jgi:hypothetical protein|nr:carboxypeptidase regulatory-like domain-containing protein [Pseudomonadota bacterium]